jgi:alkanesulfonate monooxygenase SsuD/methylene tetrahydromethanopterin reductase-like flavin-dependent oxidoreductase (luciferase family)
LRLGLALPLAPKGRDAAGFVDELVDEVCAADEAGFDVCLIPEHHNGPLASLVAPLTLTAALAAVTTRIRIGPGVLILPVHAPLHVAEQIAMIDRISHGRAVLGVGMGYQQEDFQPFGIDRAERVERFEIGLRAVAELLADHGRTGLLTVRQPRPPIWVGAWSDSGVRRAALTADGWIADPIRTITEVAAMAKRYRQARPEQPGTVVVMREAWVEDDPMAAQHFSAVIEPVFSYYRRRRAAALPLRFDDLAADRFIIGSAAQCLHQVRECAALTGADVVVLTLRHPGGPGHEDVLEAIRALGSAALSATARGET